MGSDENGMPITAFKSLLGGYHLEGEKAGLTIYTFNLLSCFGPNDDIGLIRSSAELSIDNTVHLTAAAYGDMAAVISGRTDAIVDQQAGGATRRRLASVIASASPAERRIREPEWISGQMRPPGGQRDGQRGGQRPGRGRRSWRGPPRPDPY